MNVKDNIARPKPIVNTFAVFVTRAWSLLEAFLPVLMTWTRPPFTNSVSINSK